MLSSSRNRALPPLPGSQASASSARTPEWKSNRAAHQHTDIAMATVPDCTCVFCAVNQEIDDDAEPIHLVPRFPSHSQDHTPTSLPSTHSILQVLYPPSYLGSSSSSPDPPSYSPSGSPYMGREQNGGISRPTSATANTYTSFPRISIGSVSQNPSLTRTPFSVCSGFSTASQMEPNLPLMGYDVSVEDAEPLPVYSRFDHRPRFPVASVILGPYPPASFIRQAAQ